jgi:hypothetical protein
LAKYSDFETNTHRTGTVPVIDMAIKMPHEGAIILADLIGKLWPSTKIRSHQQQLALLMGRFKRMRPMRQAATFWHLIISFCFGVVHP